MDLTWRRYLIHNKDAFLTLTTVSFQIVKFLVTDGTWKHPQATVLSFVAMVLFDCPQVQ